MNRSSTKEENDVKAIKIGEHIIPLWLVAALLISVIGVAVFANYFGTRLVIPFEVGEPIEILHYPSKFSLFSGETEEFNITLQNHASANHFVILDFHLSNKTYQDYYVTFSNEVYTVFPGQQNLTAWLVVEPYAPPVSASLTIDLMSVDTIAFQTIDRGYTSGHESQAYYVIDDADEWIDVWNQHVQIVFPQPPLPEVDFSNATIIAVFMGQFNTGGYGIEVEEVFDMGPSVVARVEKSYPGKDCFVTLGLSQPYHIVEIYKIDKPVAFDTYEKIIEC